MQLSAPSLSAAIFLVRSSFGLFSLIVASIPTLWAMVSGLAVLGIVALRRWLSHHGTRSEYTAAKWTVELCTLTAAPLFMLVIALYMWPKSDIQAPHESLALHTVAVLWIGQMLLGVFLMWRHRNRFWITSVVSGCAVVWATGADITAAMAIGNNWL